MHPSALLQRDIDIKATIIEAYEQGKMLAVLSFVRHFLEGAMSSRVFRPPNPWVVGILSLVAEVYNLEGLKTSLKFEVCRGLGRGLHLQAVRCFDQACLPRTPIPGAAPQPTPPFDTSRTAHAAPSRPTASLRWSCSSRRWACSLAT